jgi:hypothetical protein
LQARGRPDLLAKFNLLELLPYFGILYIAMHTLGLVGVAAAFSLRILIDFILRAAFSGILKASFGSLPIPVLLMGTAFFIATELEFASREWLGIVVVIFALTAIWSWRQVPIQFRVPIIAKYKKLTKRKK